MLTNDIVSFEQLGPVFQPDSNGSDRFRFSKVSLVRATSSLYEPSVNSKCLFVGLHPAARVCIECTHYENTPIQIYRKIHLQKTENFQIKTL